MGRNRRLSAGCAGMACALALFAAAFLAARAEAAGGEAAFRQGAMRISLFLGSGRAFQQDYSTVGIGGGYYVADGLETGLEAETWQGNSPHISRLTPELLYVPPLSGAVRPYVGVLYRRVFISGYRDLSDAGGRAGLVFLFDGSAYLGIGAVHDIHLACDRTVFDSCSETYPELRIAVLF